MTGVAGETLEELRAFVAARIGLDVAVDSPRIHDAIVRRARAHRVTPARYVAELARQRDADALISELTVGETYFFRHEEQLAVLIERVLPERLARAARPVRILSAGCATGEEPYSIAIAIREAGFDPGAVEIAGVDLCADSIRRGRAARFSAWALRATTPARCARWFQAIGRDHVLADEIRQAVTLEQGNLFDDDAALWPAEHYDVVMCRNVLMYFTADAMARTVARIVRSLRPGGYLFLGAAETLNRAAHALEVCHAAGAFYYRKAASSATPPGDWARDIEQSSARIRALASDVAPQPVPPPIEAPDPAPIGDVGEAAARAHERSLGSEEAGALAEALVHAHHAVALDPTFGMAWVHLGLLALRQGDAPTARLAMTRSIDALARDAEERIARYGGGFSRESLIGLCRTRLAGIEVST